MERKKGAWPSWGLTLLHNVSFSRKIALIPGLAGVAFVLVIVMTHREGSRTEDLALRLERGYAPALVLSRDLEETLTRVQRGLQDAVASAEPAMLAETDRLHDAFMSRLREAHANVTLTEEEIKRLEARFEAYYSLARGTSLRMIRGETGEDLARTLETMRVDYNRLGEALHTFARRQEEGIQQAFQAARRDHRASIGYVTGITVLCFIVLVGLSALVIRSLLNELNVAVAVADGLASGEPSRRIDAASEDEIGQLLVRMQNMVDRVEERTRELRREIGERTRAEERLRESEVRYALAARGANDGLWDWDLRTNTVYLSPRWKEIVGLDETDDEACPEDWFSRVAPEDHPSVMSTLAAHLQGVTPHFESEHRIRQKDGSWRWVLSRGFAVRERDGWPYRIAGSLTDITHRKRTEEQLIHDAFHDALTGLPNRPLFMDRLGHSVRRARRRESERYAILFIDLDRFKIVNDSLGHLVGDQLLIQIARTLERCLRPGDTVARLGGDEFAVLVDDITDNQDVIKVADRIHRELTSPFNLEGNEVFTSASIGIALGNTAYQRPEEVLRDADIALYRAKGRGRSRHEVFDAAMHAGVLARLQLDTDLRHGLERQEFRIHYQPILSLGTGCISGFEALVRWDRGARGLLSPAEFVPLAEETGLIVPLGLWVLQESCRQMSAWHREFPDLPLLSLSVNLSGRQFSDPGLKDQIAGVLLETGLPAPCLKLEITESMVIEDAEAAVSLLRELKALGVRVDIDDFGTGYSSLSNLHRFPIDTLKIDQSFVGRLGLAGENDEIVRTIVALARNLDLMVTAEGIETPEQLRQLRELGCDHGQGFLFSQPLDAGGARALIEAGRRGDPAPAGFEALVPREKTSEGG